MDMLEQCEISTIEIFYYLSSKYLKVLISMHGRAADLFPSVCFLITRLICVKQIAAYFLHGIIINEKDNESMLNLFGLNM